MKNVIEEADKTRKERYLTLHEHKKLGAVRSKKMRKLLILKLDPEPTLASISRNSQREMLGKRIWKCVNRTKQKAEGDEDDEDEGAEGDDDEEDEGADGDEVDVDEDITMEEIINTLHEEIGEPGIVRKKKNWGMKRSMSMTNIAIMTMKKNDGRIRKSSIVVEHT
jgi:hypothetical protein